MKKFFAILLAMLLVMMSFAALADTVTDPETDPVTEPEIPVPTGENIPEETTSTGLSIKKTIDSNVDGVYPAETLEFTVTETNDKITYPEDKVTVGSNNTFEMDGTKKDYTIPVNVPAASEYPEAGKYNYTVVETATQTDPAQGVTYSTKTFNVDVWIFYDKGVKQQQVNIYSGTETDEDAETKEDAFENKYDLYSLTVGKEIAGNLADPTKEFTIEITLTSTNKIASPLSIDSTSTAVVREGDGNSTGGKSYSYTVTAKGGQTATIINIPTGVTYTVKETGVDRIEESAQLANANNENAYTVTGDEGGTGATGTITKNEEVTITNTKGLQIPTGIALDTAPYMIILAIALFGLVKMASRKRREF